MASLDVLDYQAGLDAALADAQLPAPLRRQALKEARRVIDAMAFRFALLDERPLPEDIDYVRAIEAVKPPAAVAAVLARRRPLYAARRRRRLITTYTILGVIVAAIAALAWFATSEEAVELTTVTHSTRADANFASERRFNVTSDMDRLRIDGDIIVSTRSRGGVEVLLIDPLNRTVLLESFYPTGNIYLRENIYDPRPGEWTLFMQFSEAEASARVTVLGIRPTR